MALSDFEIKFPSFRSSGNAELNVKRWQPIGLFGPSNELHPGLSGGSTAFSLVTGFTGSHDVLPSLSSALDDRDDVIQRELCFVELAPAVLAGVSIPQENIRSRKANDLFSLRKRYIMQKAKDCGNFDIKAN